MLRVIAALEHGIGRFNGWALTVARWLAIGLLGVMTAIVLAGVFYRYVLNDAIAWSEEVAKFLKWRHSQRVGSLVRNLNERFEELCLDELNSHPDLDASGREALSKRLRRAARKIAHPLILEIKRTGRGRSPRSSDLELIRRAYKLEEKE